MLLAMFTLKDSISRFLFLKKTLEKQKDKPKEDFNFINITNNIKDCYIDFKNALEELRYLQQNSYYVDKSVINSAYAILPVLKTSINNAKTLEEYINAISIVTVLLEEVPNSFFENPGAGNFGTFGTYNIEDCCLMETSKKIICDAIKPPVERNFTMLNVLTRDGSDASSIKANFKNMELYGIDCTQNIETRYKENFTRLIYGPLKGSVINHDTFDIVFSIPQIDYDKNYSNLIAKREKDYIQKSIQYLRFGGTLILGLPFFRYYRDICILLSKNFSNIQLFRVNSDINSSINTICYFVGTRRKNNKNIDENIYNRLRHISEDLDNITNNSKELQEITLPKGFLEIKKFKGSVINDEELDNFYNQSNSKLKFWREQTLDTLNQEKHPLLPFNVGQIGLVLTSGILDGIVDEGDGFYHVVKGRVVHKTDNFNEITAERNSIEINETTTNRVEINAFLPDGTYKKLA